MRVAIAFCTILALAGGAPPASAAKAAAATVDVFVESYTVTRTGSACATTVCSPAEPACAAGFIPCAPAPGCVAAQPGAPTAGVGGQCKLRLYVRLAGGLARGEAAVRGGKMNGTVTVTTKNACFGEDVGRHVCGSTQTKQTRAFLATTSKDGGYTATVGPFEYDGGLRNPATLAGVSCATPIVDVGATSVGAKAAKVRDTPTLCD